MPFKKHNWIRFGNTGDIVEITIKDFTGRKLDFFRCNSKNDYRRILKILEESYGFSMDKEISNELSKEEKEEKNWLEKDVKW